MLHCRSSGITFGDKVRKFRFSAFDRLRGGERYILYQPLNWNPKTQNRNYLSVAKMFTTEAKRFPSSARLKT
jgi:hypothetical protein